MIALLSMLPVSYNGNRQCKIPSCSDLVKQAVNKRNHVDPKLYTVPISFMREGRSR